MARWNVNLDGEIDLRRANKTESVREATSHLKTVRKRLSPRVLRWEGTVRQDHEARLIDADTRETVASARIEREVI